MEGLQQALAAEVSRLSQEMMLVMTHVAVEVAVLYVSEVAAEREIHWKVSCGA